jgi:hypothetical protein
MVAELLSEEVQFEELVTSLVEVSLYLAVAKNCCVVPAAIVGLRGLICTELRDGGTEF